MLGRVVHHSAARLTSRAAPQARVEAAMKEVHDNIPSTVTRADVSGAKREAMLRAIAFSKARKGY